MNTYEMKQEARRARLAARAQRLRALAERLAQQATEQAAVIPFGQPILIGHHSEKRDRNFRKRISRAFEKAAELERLAQATAARADGVGQAGVSSDDPDAVAKLREQVAELEAKQARMKAANSALRRGDDAALHALGFSDALIAELKRGDPCGRTGYPDYALKNNSANIRRIQRRIEELSQPRESSTREVKGVQVIEDADENRLCLVFPGKPAQEVRRTLRSHGFIWSPTRTAWVRKLNNAARYAAQRVLETLPE
jgi:DNA repair exonuclease SbcCD ATPase subunit